jgi:hypothetical protein
MVWVDCIIASAHVNVDHAHDNVDHARARSRCAHKHKRTGAANRILGFL